MQYEHHIYTWHKEKVNASLCSVRWKAEVWCFARHYINKQTNLQTPHKNTNLTNNSPPCHLQRGRDSPSWRQGNWNSPGQNCECGCTSGADDKGGLEEHTWIAWREQYQPGSLCSRVRSCRSGSVHLKPLFRGHWGAFSVGVDGMEINNNLKG